MNKKLIEDLRAQAVELRGRENALSRELAAAARLDEAAALLAMADELRPITLEPLKTESAQKAAKGTKSEG